MKIVYLELSNDYKKKCGTLDFNLLNTNIIVAKAYFIQNLN